MKFVKAVSLTFQGDSIEEFHILFRHLHEPSVFTLEHLEHGELVHPSLGCDCTPPTRIERIPPVSVNCDHIGGMVSDRDVV